MKKSSRQHCLIFLPLPLEAASDSPRASAQRCSNVCLSHIMNSGLNNGIKVIPRSPSYTFLQRAATEAKFLIPLAIYGLIPAAQHTH